jgi:transcriptional regulator GlxA family with amidase domain
MIDKRRIVLITYHGAELLDVTGPSAVFAAANRVTGHTLYDIVVASPKGGIVQHSSAIELVTLPLYEIEIGARDTVLVVGADTRPLAATMAEAVLKSALQSAAQSAERYGSICTGVFLLGAAGLLQGRTVATHWAASSQFERLFKDARCDSDALYVTDECLWTSAGVTTGIDMALAMLDRDHGSALKASVARLLVVYSHRPGHQSQFSDLLTAQGKEDERFVGLVNWLKASTAIPVSVEKMAEHVNMSSRSFHRRFVQSFGQPPAKFFETIRLDTARSLLAADVSVADAAKAAGFRSESAFRSAFKAQFGVTPQLYRQSWQSR